MKLLRYGPAGKEKPGLLDSNGKIRDLSRVIDDISGAALSPASLRKIAKLNEKRLPLVKGRPRLGPPVVPRRTFAIALNYALHAKEAGVKVPTDWHEQVKVWFVEKYVPAHANDSPHPNRDDSYAAARKQFPDWSIDRDRDWRDDIWKNHAPDEWTKRGPK